MNKLTTWLNQPYPFDGTWKVHVRSAIWGGLFVSLFLFVFKPFGFQYPESLFWKFVKTCIYFGLTTSATMLVYAAISEYFTGFFNEKSWVIWKEIFANILVVMMIGTANMLLATVLFNQKISLKVFLYWQMATFAIGIFPILFTAYTKHLVLQKRHTSHAESLNTKIAIHAIKENKDEPMIELRGDNQNEQLNLNPADLLYLEAADNYVKVFARKNGILEKNMLRSTLKKMESQLEEHDQFFRCHRTYIVNLNKVEQVSGNAQGYKLHLKELEDLIPVSRSLNAEIDRRLG